jgi:hypothetical protein
MLAKEALGCASVILTFVAYSRYFWDIYKRRIKPHVFTWAVWTLLVAIAFLAQRSHDTGPGTWALGADAGTCLACAVLAFFRGEKDIRKSDWAAFLGALAAIPLWVFTGNPLGAVVVVVLIDALAYYPTFRKSWLKPQEETTLYFSLSAVGFVLSVLALDRLTLVTALYPLFIIISDSALVLMLLWRRVVLARKENVKR